MTNTTQENIVKAQAKYIRMSPSKVQRVLNQIRGCSYEEALLILKFMPYSSCAPIIKLLRSSIANARNNFGIDEKTLTIKSVFVDPGPTMKRFRRRSRGKAYQILKPTAYITMIMR